MRCQRALSALPCVAGAQRKFSGAQSCGGCNPCSENDLHRKSLKKTCESNRTRGRRRRAVRQPQVICANVVPTIRALPLSGARDTLIIRSVDIHLWAEYFLVATVAR